jgi:hypothetical protein
MKTERELVGRIGVDAGLCWVGDPCYVLGDDASDRVRDWGTFCEALKRTGQYEKGHCQPLGPSVGLAISTGYGDGHYPVFVERENGCISRVTIEFIGSEQENEL